MLDIAYTDPRLVAVYAALHGEGLDTDFYRRLTRPGPADVLDLGCGTGRLASLLAMDGHRVTGVDPATAMLAVARRRDPSRLCRWVEGDARDLALGRNFDFIMMTGHAFQVLLDDDDMGRAIGRAHAHVRPGGAFAFESRNPAARGWEQWTPRRSRRMVEVERLGPVEMYHEVTDVAGDCVTFRTAYYFALCGETINSSSTLRFADRHVIETHLLTAGFESIEVNGSWGGTTAGDPAPELVIVARRGSPARDSD